MSNQYPGGIVSKTAVVPTSLVAPGIWTLSQQAAAQATNTWPFPRDPQFKNVTMLLHGDGSAGAVATGSGAGASPVVTNFNADASTNNFNVTINGDARSDNFTPYQAGYYSYSGNGSTTYALAPNNTAFDQNAAFTLEWYDFLVSNGAAQAPFYVNTSGYLTVYRQAAGGYQLDKSGTGSLYLSSAYSFSAWHYIAISYDGTSTRMYVDGVLLYTHTGGGVACGTTPELGRGNGGINVNGYISNLRFTKSALYTGSTMTVPTTPLTAITNCTFLAFQSNRFIDNSTNNLTITTFNSPSVSPAQPFTLPSSVATYGSGYFDGTGDYLTAPSNSAFAMGTGDFTIECWVNTPLVGSSDDVFIELRASGATSTGFVFNVHQTGVGYQLNFYTDGGSNLGSTVLNYNVWNHCAVTRSGTTVRLFSNGVVSATFTKANNFSDTPVPRIGSSPLYSPSSVIGYISNLRVVKGTAVYTSAFTPPTSPLTAVTNTQLLTTQYNGGGNNSGFKDSSQFNFPITRNGNTTQGTFTPYGSNWSNYFDGSGDYLTTPQNAAFNLSTAAFTVEAFIYMTANNGSNMRIIGLGDGVNASPAYYSGWAFAVVSSLTALQFIKYDGTEYSTTTSYTFSLNTWYHVVAVRNSSSSFSMYVNGTRISNATVTTSFNNVNSNALNLGYTYDGASPAGVKYFNGYISNARVVAGTAVYDPTVTTLTVPTTPLTAITNTAFLTSQSNRFIDTSSNAFAITSNGNTSVQRFSPFAPLTVYNPTTYGGSTYFDGTGDYLTIADNATLELSTSSFTMEWWSYPTTFASNQFQLSKCATSASTEGFLTYINTSGVLKFNANSVSAWDIANDQGTLALKLNAWNHCAISRSGSSWRMWVNGASSVTITSALGVQNTTTAYSVGGAANGSAPFLGYVNDTRIVIGSYVYDPSSSTLTVPTAPLTAITNTSLLLNYTNSAILDNSMLNNLETVGNAAVSTSVKKYGAGSLYFDGNGDNLSNPTTPDLNMTTGNWTIECWVYILSRTLNYPLIFGNNNGSYTTGALALVISNSDSPSYNDRFCLSVKDHLNAPTLVASSTNSSNTWYHLAVVRNGTSLVMYRDGTSVASATISSGLGFDWGKLGSRIGGGNWDGAQSYFNGYIDDLRITKGVARYTATFTVPDQAFPNG